MGDLIRARGYFERLAAVDPEHPMVRAFEAQIGESLSGAAAPAAEAAEAPTEESAPAEASTPAEASAPAEEEAPEPAVEPEAPAEPAPPAEVDEAKIAQLRADLEEQEGAKRYHEYVKTLVALADEVPDVAEKVELYMKAADLYVNKFVNQAEAVRTYEHILEVDRDESGRHRLPAPDVRESGVTGRS